MQPHPMLLNICLLLTACCLWWPDAFCVAQTAQPAPQNRSAASDLLARVKDQVDPVVRIATIDISDQSDRHVMVAHGSDQLYQGHPTTLLLPDGKTIYCVWTLNHGGPCGPLKRSDDGGRTWSELLDVPANWRTVRNCPTLYRLPDPDGTERLWVFAGQGPDGTMHQSHSDDNGRTWTPMVSNGLTCVMPFCGIVPVHGGQQLLALTNIRRPGEQVEARSNVLAASSSRDGGFTWSNWRVVLDIPGCKPCEPEIIRSPDGKQLLCLIRENNRHWNAWWMTSDDEGAELVAALATAGQPERRSAPGRLRPGWPAVRLLSRHGPDERHARSFRGLGGYVRGYRQRT